jgi:hypothetical protein
MNNQPNSPTPPPSDLYSLQMTQIKKITLPIFDETKLPSSWSSLQQEVLEDTAMRELEIQQRLTTVIRCAKIYLEASLLSQEQTEQKIQELWHLYQMYYETKSIIDRFDRYLLDKHKPAIRALAMSQEQTEQKIQELWHLYQMYYETKWDHQPLRLLPSRQTQTRNQSFSNVSGTNGAEDTRTVASIPDVL